MRMVLFLLCLEGTAAFAQLGSSQWNAQGPQLNWTFGVQRSQPTITTSAQGSKDGRVSLVDTDADLGLTRDGSPLGAFLEYKTGPHGFRVAYDSTKLRGDRTLGRDISLNGVPYASGVVLHSTAKLTVLEGLYTYKFSLQPDAWVGFDLGVQQFKSELTAANLTTMAPAQGASPSMTLPQIGISGGSSGVNGLLESNTFLRYFTYKGASWYRYGLDGRAYLYPNFGLRAFYEAGRIKIPAGSTQGDLDIRMETRTFGLGLVLRF
jgi:hypothetical protein